MPNETSNNEQISSVYDVDLITLIGYTEVYTTSKNCSVIDQEKYIILQRRDGSRAHFIPKDGKSDVIIKDEYGEKNVPFEVYEQSYREITKDWRNRNYNTIIPAINPVAKKSDKISVNKYFLEKTIKNINEKDREYFTKKIGSEEEKIELTPSELERLLDNACENEKGNNLKRIKKTVKEIFENGTKSGTNLSIQNKGDFEQIVFLINELIETNSDAMSINPERIQIPLVSSYKIFGINDLKKQFQKVYAVKPFN